MLNPTKVVVLPHPDAVNCPSWLGWTSIEWQTHKDLWYNQLNAIFGVEEYLQRTFLADARVEEATLDLEKARPANASSEPQEPIVHAAARWLRRVEV